MNSTIEKWMEEEVERGVEKVEGKEFDKIVNKEIWRKSDYGSEWVVNKGVIKKEEGKKRKKYMNKKVNSVFKVGE